MGSSPWDCKELDTTEQPHVPHKKEWKIVSTLRVVTVIKRDDIYIYKHIYILKNKSININTCLHIDTGVYVHICVSAPIHSRHSTNLKKIINNTVYSNFGIAW